MACNLTNQFSSQTCITPTRDALLSARGGLCAAAIKDGTLDMINAALGERTIEQSFISARVHADTND
jgi:hypothetical protein